MTESNDGADRTTATHRTESQLSRRAALGLLGVGGVGLLTGGAAAPPAGAGGGAIYDWQQDVDANGQAIERLGALSMAGNAPITSFTGRGLSINDEGELFAHPSPDVSTDAEGGGIGIVVKEARNIVAGAGLVARESAPGEATLDVELGSIDADTLDGHDADEFVLKGDGADGTTGAVAVGLSAQQGVDDGTDVVVAFDDVDVDLRDEFDADAHAFVASADGTNHVDAHLTVAVVGGDDASFDLRLERERDGSPETVGFTQIGTTEQLSMSLSRVLSLEAGDALRVRFSPNGKDTALVDFGERGTVFSVHRVA